MIRFISKSLFFMLLLFAACSPNEPNDQEEDVVYIRIINHNETVIDSIELRYQSLGPFASLFVPTLIPNDTSSFEKIKEVHDKIMFNIWADSTKYDNDWYLPASVIDPTNAMNNRFPRGYYSFSVLHLDDNTNSATVGLIDFSLY